MKTTSRSTTLGGDPNLDVPAVYYGPAQPGFGGTSQDWRCRRCRRTVDNHYLTGSDGCVPREVLRDLMWDLEQAAEQVHDDESEPPAVRQALAVLREHGWQLKQEHRHPELDHPHPGTRLVARQMWQDRPRS